MSDESYRAGYRDGFRDGFRERPFQKGGVVNKRPPDEDLSGNEHLTRIPRTEPTERARPVPPSPPPTTNATPDAGFSLPDPGA